MASYFRNLFGWGSSRQSRSSSQPPTASSSKLHSRSHSSSTVPAPPANYIYASSGSSHVAAVPPPILPVPPKTNSYSLPRTATPSPLRYESDIRPSSSRERARIRPKMNSSASDSKAAQAAQIYGRHTYKSKEQHHGEFICDVPMMSLCTDAFCWTPVHYPHFVQSGYGTAGSSRSNSSSSIYAMPPPAPLSSSSRHNIAAAEPPARRPQLKQNHTWHGGAGVSASATSHSSSRKFL